MSDKALGLIETMGLIGAIEATDAAAKAAAVVVSSVELTDATFLTLKIEGDLGAVQAAVEAGAEAAEKVGELIAVHVIANPDNGLRAIMPNLRYVSKYHPDEKRPTLTFENSETAMPTRLKPARPKPGQPRATITKENNVTKPQDLKADELEKQTVPELRQYARSLENMPLKGREISMANKTELIDAIKKALKQ